MNELIWIGNTLLPRWLVFLAMGSIASAVIVAFIAITSRDLTE